MTSPDRIRPDKAQSPQTVGGFLQDYDPDGAGAANNLWLTQRLEEFRTGLINGILSGFQNIGGAVDQAISAISLALSGAPGGLEALEDWAHGLPIIGDLVEQFTGEDGDLNDIGSWIRQALGRDSSLSGRVSAIEGKIAEGADFYDAFDRGDSDNLGINYRQFGTGSPLGVYDQAAQIKHVAIGLQVGRRHAITEKELSGNAFTVQVVVHPSGQSSAVAMQVYARMNADCTEGLSVNLFAGKCYLARMTRNPTTNAQTMVDLGSNLTKSYSNSATVTFQGDDDDHLWVYIDGKLIIEVPPGANVGPRDAAHRRAGFSEGTAVGLPAQYSGAPASFSMRSTVEIQQVSETAAIAATAAVAPVAVVAQDASESSTSVGQQVNSIAQLLAQPGFPSWVSGADRNAEVTIPIALVLASAPLIQTTAATAAWAFKTIENSGDKVNLAFQAQAGSGTCTSFYVDVFLLREDGSIVYVASTVDVSTQITTTALNWVTGNLTAPVSVSQGNVVALRFRTAGSASIGLAGVQLTNPPARVGMRPYNLGGSRANDASPFATLTPSQADAIYNGNVPFCSLGVVPVDPSRYYYDDFNRSKLGSTWSLRNVGAGSNAIIIDGRYAFGGTQDGTQSGLWYEQTVTDSVAIEFDVYGTSSTGAGGWLCWNGGATFGLFCVVYNDRVVFGSGSMSSQTLRATYPGGGDGHYKFTYDPDTNAFSAYKDGTLLGDPWVDSGNVIKHGNGNRYGGLFTRRFNYVNSGFIDNFSLYDM